MVIGAAGLVSYHSDILSSAYHSDIFREKEIESMSCPTFRLLVSGRSLRVKRTAKMAGVAYEVVMVLGFFGAYPAHAFHE